MSKFWALSTTTPIYTFLENLSSNGLIGELASVPIIMILTAVTVAVPVIMIRTAVNFIQRALKKY